ncbi:hypothetical protein GE061_009124 [Apolygus lucorum]|uniref:Uncharacterized protein n=1 Tax=Apolygus lucorum TaxID=248454 RepID=A0A8S9Y0M2_APOLU|nr:hypothetical protein GE061_009124 [Apolygus lucorum]
MNQNLIGLYPRQYEEIPSRLIGQMSDDKIPETALMPSFLSTFGLASLQGTKLGMGESTTSICMYGSYQVVQMDLEGLSLTFVGSTECNTGHILAISKELYPVLLELRTKTEFDASQP